MTLKRLLLGILTLFAIVLMGTSLVASWSKPQIQSRLELHQTDLILQASVLKLDSDSSLASFRSALLGKDPIQTALQDYSKARQRAQQAPPKPEQDSSTLAALIADLDVRLGLLHSQEQDSAAALSIWNAVTTTQPAPPSHLVNTARVLAGLWREPPQVAPQAEQILQANLSGWFRDQALVRLYRVSQEDDRLRALQANAQIAAQQAVNRLLVLSIIPTSGLVLGGGLLAVLIVQRLLKGKDSLLASISTTHWTVPWDWETVWQVFIVGFFWLGQLLVPQVFLPLVFNVAQIAPSSFTERDRALWILINYGVVAAVGLLTLYWSLRPSRPLPPEWFRLNWWSPWLLWGIGGYLVATPIVILVSLLNQQLWQGQGGSNPILPIALNSGDPLAIACFFLTASLAAPVFEEIMFRGFLLPSLTRYVPVWGAIGISSLLFALAHLSLSEVLPLTALGCVLSIVYLRSRSLLAPILLHSIWNGFTLLSLLMLSTA